MEVRSYNSCLICTKPKGGSPFPEGESVRGAYEKSVYSSESDAYKMLPVTEKDGCRIKQYYQIQDQLGSSDFMNHQTLDTASDTGSIATHPCKFNNDSTYGIDGSLSEHGDMSVKSSAAGDPQHALVGSQLGHCGYHGSVKNESQNGEQLLANVTRDDEAHRLSFRHPRFPKSPIEVASSYESYTKAAPSLDFFVMSDDGISLYVDLNSSTSEWIQKLKDEVCINQKIEHQSLGSTNHTRGVFDVDVQLNPLQPETTVLNLQKEADTGIGFTNSSFGSVFSGTGQQVYPLDATMASSGSSILTSSSNPIDICNQVVSSRFAYSNSQNLTTTDNTSTQHKVNILREDPLDNPSRKEQMNTGHEDVGISIAHNSASAVHLENNILKSDVSLNNMSDSNVGTNETHMCIGNKSSLEIESRCGFMFTSCHGKSLGSCQFGGQSNLNSVTDLCQSHSSSPADYLPKDSDSSFRENLVKNIADLQKDTLECLTFQNSADKVSKRSCNPEIDGVILNNKKRRSDRNNKNGSLSHTLSSTKEFASDPTIPRRSSRFLSK